MTEPTSSEATPSEATPSEATPSEATPSESTPSESTPSEAAGERTVIVVGPDGQPVGQMRIPAEGADKRPDPAEQVEQPAKVMRIGTMIKQLLEEVRAAPLDEASRSRLKEIYSRSITELEEGLSPELRDELDRLSLPFNDDGVPSESELRIAQAQLVGWLEGLFHGLQTALFAQQMAARVQLEQMRGRALPPGSMPGLPGQPQQPGDQQHGAGQYL